MSSAATTGVERRGGQDPSSRPVTGLVLGALAYFVLGLLGRLTIVDGEVLTLVWPAAGASVLMFGLTRPRLWGLATALVVLATVVLNLLAGATSPQVVIFIAANVAQALGAVLALRAVAPQLRGAGGEQPLEQLKDFWPIVAASAAGALAGSVVASVGRGLLLDSWSAIDLLVWWGRNAVGSVVVITTCVLALSAWDRRGRTLSGVGAELRGKAVTRGVEMVLVAATTTAIYLLVFVVYPSVPVAFPLLVPTVWVGLRFGPLPVALHSLAVCTAVVLFTLDGRGSFAAADSWHEEILVSQLFIGLVFCLGTLLSLGRGERLALTATLSAERAASESQNRLLATVIESMHDGISLIDESGQIVLRNSAGAQVGRYSVGETNHVRDSQFRFVTTDGQEMTEADHPWTRALAGDLVVEQDVVLVFDDGSPSRTLAMTARRLPNVGPGLADQALVVYRDVTEERAQRSALESFAAVVAHDLQGPLGVVDGWTEMLALDLETTGSLTTDEATPKLDRIRAAAGGMRHLITDMLESAVSRDQQLRSAVVDLDSVARSVAEQRSTVTGAEAPRIDIGPLPPVYGDEALVRQLLDNLIGNAVKYVVPGEVARVHVNARVVGELVEVSVADEGIGIPPSQRDEIFEVFQRAHAAQDYAGHGIGLSVCKRIVERHGGRIYARSPLGGRGARIVFTLPTAPERDPA